MLNFNTSIQETIATQEKTTRTSAFTEYNSKKKLFAAGILTAEQEQYIAQLKGTFTFHIHNENRYLVVTMYYSATKTYGFIIVDLNTLQCATADSIKNAKKGVLDVIASTNTEEPKTEENMEQETVTTETETPNETGEGEKPKRNRRK